MICGGADPCSTLLVLKLALQATSDVSSCADPVHPVCRPHAEKYAESQDAFFEDYVKAHLKLSEQGAEWTPEPITL